MSLVEEIFSSLKPQRTYIDKSFKGDHTEFLNALTKSTTIWVGNLNKECPEDKIWALFSKCGEIKRVIMGINACNFYQCGFCFIEFYERDSALKALQFDKFNFSGKQLNINIDHGFEEGRQFGRGFFGNLQKRDFTKRHKR